MNTLSSMPFPRLVRAQRLEAKYAIVRALRMPGFAFPFLVLPAALYVVLGVVMQPAQPTAVVAAAIANRLLVAFCIFAAAGPGLFGGCLFLAFEREGGLLRLKCVLPMPAGANFVGKAATALVFSALASTILLAAALVVNQITLTAWQLLAIWAVTIIGTIPLLAVGLCIGACVPGPAAPAVGNMFFLPMLWFSGMFFPVPSFLQRWAVILPTYQLNHLALAVAGIGNATVAQAVTAGWVLLGVSVFFGAVAQRRLAHLG